MMQYITANRVYVDTLKHVLLNNVLYKLREQFNSVAGGLEQWPMMWEGSVNVERGEEKIFKTPWTQGHDKWESYCWVWYLPPSYIRPFFPPSSTTSLSPSLAPYHLPSSHPSLPSYLPDFLANLPIHRNRTQVTAELYNQFKDRVS